MKDLNAKKIIISAFWSILLFIFSGCTEIQQFQNTLIESSASETQSAAAALLAAEPTAALIQPAGGTPEATSNPEQVENTNQSAAVPLVDPDSVEPTPDTRDILLWIPPQFDPQQNTRAGEALADAIAAFNEIHPDINITLRVKATVGDSSVINNLSAAANAAKDALPSLALLSRSDMETAVQKGLIQPIESDIFTENNSWYNYARQAAMLDNTIYGIPVAGDGLILAYRNSKIGAELTDWKDILSRGLPIAFAPASSSSLFASFIYLGSGGTLTNDQGQFAIDQQKLLETLNFFVLGGQNGAFPPSLVQIADQNQAWQRFNDGTMNMVISQFSTFRHYQDNGISACALPLAEEAETYPLVSTWNLVMTEDNPELQKASMQFAEFLAGISVNDDFTLKAGYLPVRSSDHESWQTDPQFTMVSIMSRKATLIPGNTLLSKAGPILNNAVSQVIKNALTPDEAVQEAMTSINEKGAK